jgi:hypothetical protein
MNAEKERALADLARRNPFWVCFSVFLLLAVNNAFSLVNLVEQRQQLDKAQVMQTQNRNALTQAQELELRLQALSLDLIQVAATNPAAKQIVQEFNIQWHPGPSGPSASGSNTNQSK